MAMLKTSGINQNKGQKICLRLRYPGDKNQFLPFEDCVDTMLHELAHIVHSPHNSEFHALWDQLRKEYQGLLSKGYTGEGFMSEGHRLGGGRRVPPDEARRIARAAAEKRRTLYAGSGQKLGGAPVPVGADIRRVIIQAIERRNKVLKGCGSGEQRNNKEMNDLANQATRNGFKTQADEDEANEQAIAQAMWELVQEDEKKEYGDSFVPSTAENPTGSGGGNLGNRSTIKREASSPAKTPKPKQTKAPPIRQHPGRPVSRLVAEASTKKATSPSKNRVMDLTRSSTSTPAPAAAVTSDPPPPEPLPNGWTCPICTLHNPLNFLSCDACTSERPAEILKQIEQAGRKKVKTTQPQSLQVQTWKCQRCTTEMDNKWWTCSTCGQMKTSS